MMLNILFIIAVSVIGISTFSKATPLEINSFSLLSTKIKSEELNFKEVGLVYGFASIQSCIYSNENFIVLKNYCYPKKKYRAQGYTIISPEFGIVELYEETFSVSEVQRDIRVNVLPAPLRPYLSSRLDELSLSQLNSILEKISQQNLPACWSTNMSMKTGEPQAACNVGDLVDFDRWANETQILVNSKDAWNNLIMNLNQKFNY